MIPGPVLIKKCISCSGLFMENSILSGNTFGAIFWTDGKIEAPMLPDMPMIGKCPHCQTLIWLDKQEEIDDTGSYSHAKEIIYLDTDDYFALVSNLTNKPLDKNREEYLRFKAWHGGNDKRRHDNSPQKETLSAAEVDNLNALFDLLDPENKDQQLLLKAEIKRELGEFEACLRLLNEGFSKDMGQAVTIIKTLAQNKVPYVAKIK